MSSSAASDGGEPASLVDLVHESELAADGPHAPVADALRTAPAVSVRRRRQLWSELADEGRSPPPPRAARTPRRSRPARTSPWGTIQSPYFGRWTTSTSGPACPSRTTTPPAAADRARLAAELLQLLPLTRARTRVRSSLRARKRSIRRPAASRPSGCSSAHARTRSSATTASWCSPSSSWSCLAAVDESLAGLAELVRRELGGVAGTLDADAAVVQRVVGRARPEVGELAPRALQLGAEELAERAVRAGERRLADRVEPVEEREVPARRRAPRARRPAPAHAPPRASRRDPRRRPRPGRATPPRPAGARPAHPGRVRARGSGRASRARTASRPPTPARRAAGRRGGTRAAAASPRAAGGRPRGRRRAGRQDRVPGAAPPARRRRTPSASPAGVPLSSSGGSSGTTRSSARNSFGRSGPPSLSAPARRSAFSRRRSARSSPSSSSTSSSRKRREMRRPSKTATESSSTSAPSTRTTSRLVRSRATLTSCSPRR